MNDPGPAPGRPMPRPLAFLVGSVVALHLLAILLLVLAAPSGPWATAMGNGISGPPFALGGGERATRYYLAPLKMTHNYHFLRNRPGQAAVRFEVRLRDETGRLIETRRFPDPDANFWVRHRQTLLAQHLADDQPVAPRGSEAIPAPNQAVRTVDVWEMGPDQALHLRRVPEHLLPRDRQVFRPSEWSLILTRSYCRYLCREHGAASAELVRHTREAIPPAFLQGEGPPAEVFQTLVTHFEEVKK